MKSVLQNLVKIIIIGNALGITTVHCHREGYPLPPLPYYQNHNYAPDFIFPYPEQAPIYYPEKNFQSSLIYPKVDYYSPALHFHPNKNYNPHLSLDPGVNYETPNMDPYRTDYQYQDFLPSQTLKPPPKYQIALYSDQEGPNVQSSAIIQKNEGHQSQQNDDLKNYHDEDYSENFGEDSSFQADPCITNSPYRYFEHDLNDPTSNKQFSLCGPYFYPNFGNNVYGLKTPLTLLPSRFPPRVEEFIAKIQNYFSTYTQMHQNQTQAPPTIQPTIATVSESETFASLQTANFDKKNGTSENQGETNLELTPVTEISNVEQVTEKTEVVAAIQNEQTYSTTEADVINHETPQMEVLNTKEPSQIMEYTTQANPIQSLPTGKTSQGAFPTEMSLKEDNHTYEFSTNELDKVTEIMTERQVFVETETQVASTEIVGSLTESPETENKTENYYSRPTTNQILLSYPARHNLHQHNR